jgi:hypothetical protein
MSDFGSPKKSQRYSSNGNNRSKVLIKSGNIRWVIIIDIKERLMKDPALGTKVTLQNSSRYTPIERLPDICIVYYFTL